MLRTSERVKEAAYAEAGRLARPIRYLESSGWDKEKIAERALAEQPIGRGLICLLTAVEPCMSFECHRSPNRDERGLRLRPKKCLHLYKYCVYDKAGSILRVETTIGRTQGFKVLRPAHDDPKGELAWRPLRKGVADLHRRAQLSQRSNDAYMEALSAVEDTTPCAEVFDAVSRSILEKNRRFRALRLSHPADLALLEAISRGEFATAGFRNRDIRPLIHRSPANITPRERRRLSARTSRKIRLLRAHGVIRKIPKTHRYRLTPNGHILTAALQATRRANIKDLLKAA